MLTHWLEAAYGARGLGSKAEADPKGTTAGGAQLPKLPTACSLVKGVKDVLSSKAASVREFGKSRLLYSTSKHRAELEEKGGQI